MSIKFFVPTVSHWRTPGVFYTGHAVLVRFFKWRMVISIVRCPREID